MMMSIENNSVVNSSQVQSQCKVCGGRGTILVYRSDLEAFEEIECESCK
jgi:hypothetical protein